jgi:hypothetical protein
LTAHLAHAGHPVDDQHRKEQHEQTGQDRRGERMCRPKAAHGPVADVEDDQTVVINITVRAPDQARNPHSIGQS